VAEPYIGEIRVFAGNFAPAGWVFCDGQLLPIAENEALFTLLGTMYGGDGQSTFAVPDLRGRLALHAGNGVPPGQSAGTETVALTTDQLPAHTHAFQVASSRGTLTSPAGKLPAQSVTVVPYTNHAPSANLHPDAITGSGAGDPHGNMQPYLCISSIISLFGIYPSSG